MNPSPWGAFAEGLAGGINQIPQSLLAGMQLGKLKREADVANSLGLLAQKKQAEYETQKWVNERDEKLNTQFANDPNYKPIKINPLPDPNISFEDMYKTHIGAGNYEGAMKVQEEMRKQKAEVLELSEQQATNGVALINTKTAWGKKMGMEKIKESYRTRAKIGMAGGLTPEQIDKFDFKDMEAAHVKDLMKELGNIAIAMQKPAGSPGSMTREEALVASNAAALKAGQAEDVTADEMKTITERVKETNELAEKLAEKQNTTKAMGLLRGNSSTMSQTQAEADLIEAAALAGKNPGLNSVIQEKYKAGFGKEKEFAPQVQPFVRKDNGKAELLDANDKNIDWSKYKPYNKPEDISAASEKKQQKQLSVLSQAMINLHRKYGASGSQLTDLIVALQGGTAPQADKTILDKMSEPDKKRYVQLETQYNSVLNKMVGMSEPRQDTQPQKPVVNPSGKTKSGKNFYIWADGTNHYNPER